MVELSLSALGVRKDKEQELNLKTNSFKPSSNAKFFFQLRVLNEMAKTHQACLF
jgi:hypothetical protein